MTGQTFALSLVLTVALLALVFDLNYLNRSSTLILRSDRVQGSDVTDIGSSNLGQDNGPSWIVGDHRQPMWSQSQTYSFDGLEPYNDLYGRLLLRKLDRGHFFQQDTNPWQDKRMVFDPNSPNDFPWDPTVQCWDTGNSPEQRNGNSFVPLTPGCFKRQPRPIKARKHTHVPIEFGPAWGARKPGVVGGAGIAAGASPPPPPPPPPTPPPPSPPPSPNTPQQPSPSPPRHRRTTITKIAAAAAAARGIRRCTQAVRRPGALRRCCAPAGRPPKALDSRVA